MQLKSINHQLAAIDLSRSMVPLSYTQPKGNSFISFFSHPRIMPVYWILPLPARSCKWNIDLLWRQEQQTSLFPDPFWNNMLLWGRVTLLLIALAMVWIHLPTAMFNSMLCKISILLNVMPRAFCPRFSHLDDPTTLFPSFPALRCESQARATWLTLPCSLVLVSGQTNQECQKWRKQGC